jgi:lipopolysaccharide/colanic/teichoic acid biosynthesis glycosyltransferase
MDSKRAIVRARDICAGVGGLVVCFPLFVIVAVGIYLSSPGPVLYHASRIGRDRRRAGPPSSAVGAHLERRRRDSYSGREFTLYKFRTMRIADRAGAPITAWKDERLFAFGEWLRATKIDELPQLFNLIRGDVTMVGPRPEAPEIVRRHYSGDDLETLKVTPGLTSPGSIHYYTHHEALLREGSAVDVYVERILPLKLALDRVYIENAGFLYDLRIVARTLIVVISRAMGVRRFADPPELAKATGRLAGSLAEIGAPTCRR